VKLYSGGDGSLAGMERIRELGMGRMVTAAGWRNPKPGMAWALDNGAFSDWQRCLREGRAMSALDFDGDRFVKVLRKVPPTQRPDFAVIPDLVAEGLRSLTFSCQWLHGFQRPALPHGWPWYLAVQDGMGEADVSPLVNRIGGIFVGGSLDWKHETGEAWVRFAHENGLPCHIGRVGTLPDLKWAERIGADSVDSTSWAQNNTYEIVEAARAQRTLAEVAPVAE
jgi:hypothetical protein